MAPITDSNIFSLILIEISTGHCLFTTQWALWATPLNYFTAGLMLPVDLSFRPNCTLLNVWYNWIWICFSCMYIWILKVIIRVFNFRFTARVNGPVCQYCSSRSNFCCDPESAPGLSQTEWYQKLQMLIESGWKILGSINNSPCCRDFLMCSQLDYYKKKTQSGGQILHNPVLTILH